MALVLSLTACSQDKLTNAPAQDQEFIHSYTCGSDGTRSGLDASCRPEGDFVEGCGVIYVSLNSDFSVQAYNTETGQPIARYETIGGPRRTATDTKCNGYSTGYGAHKFTYGCVPSGSPTERSSDCVAWSRTLPDATDSTAIALDLAEHVWVGTMLANDEGKAFKLDSETGEVLAEVSGLDASYGLAVDSRGNMWSISKLHKTLTKIDTVSNSIDKVIDLAPANVYGFAVAQDDTIVYAHGGCIGLYRPYPEPGSLEGPFCPSDGKYSWVRGVATRTLPDGRQEYFATGATSAEVVRYDADGNFLGRIPDAGHGVMGVAFDAEGDLWTVGYLDNTVSEFREIGGEWWQQENIDLGATPYVYSDMTGYQLSQFINEPATWTLEVEASDGLQFASAEWLGEAPGDTRIEIQVYSGENWESLGEYLPSEKNPYTLRSPENHRVARIVLRLYNAIDEQAQTITKPRVDELLITQTPIEP